MCDMRDEVQAPVHSRYSGRPVRDALTSWREAEAVCFDVDCTVTKQDSLDLLAHFLGRGEQVAALTSKVKHGH